MIKSTILLAVSLFGFVAAPLTVRQNAEPRVITVPVQIITDGPAPISLVDPLQTVQTTPEVVVSVPKVKKVQATSVKDEPKPVRCQVRELQQGFGLVRTCE